MPRVPGAVPSGPAAAARALALGGHAGEEACLVDLEALVRSLDDALDFVVAFDVEHEAATVDLPERRANGCTHPHRRGRQVADVDPRAHRPGPGREPGLDGTDGGELEERHQAGRGQDVDARVPKRGRRVGGLNHDLDFAHKPGFDGHQGPPVQCGGRTRKSRPRPVTRASSATTKDRSLIRSRTWRPTYAPTNITAPMPRPSALVSGVRSA